jgi:hypothetical protein
MAAGVERWRHSRSAGNQSYSNRLSRSVIDGFGNITSGRPSYGYVKERKGNVETKRAADAHQLWAPRAHGEPNKGHKPDGNDQDKREG